MRRWLMRGFGVAVVLFAGLIGYLRWGGIPLHAARSTPPPGVDHTALAVGAPTPPIELASADGTTWRGAAALASGPLVLVFYRGHW